MGVRWFCCALVLAVAAQPVLAADTKPKTSDNAVFGALRPLSHDAAKAKALAWLKTTGKTDVDSLKRFKAIWTGDRPVLDCVSDTLMLGDADAAKLLADAADASKPAPQEVPALLKDKKVPDFLRANLALAYAKALSQRRIYEEALDALKAIQPEQVVDPAAYFFHRAVAEYSMLQKTEASRSIVRLLDDVDEAPERYRMVAALMYFDMQSWKDKDLAWIGRKMSNIERRLELARGGQITQKQQREVIIRLDEMIKELENDRRPGPPSDGPRKPGPRIPRRPLDDPDILPDTGDGKVDDILLKQVAELWGKLPEKERARAIMMLTRDMPARHRELVENYLRVLARSDGR